MWTKIVRLSVKAGSGACAYYRERSMIFRRRDKHVHADETGNISFISELNEDDPYYPNRVVYYVLVIAMVAVFLFGIYTLLMILDS